MDDFRNTTERLFIDADGNTKLDVLYTNEPHKVEEILTLYEEWLREDRYKFVGLDLSTHERIILIVVEKLPLCNWRCASMFLFISCARPGRSALL